MSFPRDIAAVPGASGHPAFPETNSADHLPEKHPYTHFPIDAVYLWVDGNDPYHVVSRHQHISHRSLRGSPSLSPFRFRDNNELRISLRLLHRNAPWIRHIFIVTDNQVPGWLDPDAPQITIVDHRTILPEGVARPCFNSFVIESHLRRIPGLAEHFIYLNDDFMIGRPVEPDDFVTAHGTENFLSTALRSGRCVF